MPEGWLVPIRDAVSDDQAASLLLQGITAHALVHRCARLQPGESVVVEAAAGGTGTLAVQLAKRAGARVIGLASSEEKRALVARLGADATVDSRADDLGAAILEANDGREVDAVFEMSGGEAFEACLRTLAPFGRMVTFGIASGEQNKVATGHLMRHSRAVIGFWLMHLIPQREEIATMIARPVWRRRRRRARGDRRRRLPALRGGPGARGPRRAAYLGQAAPGPEPMTETKEATKAFSELGLKPEILLALDELGYTEPTAVQEQVIPELLAGHDVIGQAQTGTGKTAAFGLPLLQYLDPDSEETQAIVMTPTRELCIQVTQALRAYAEHLDVEIVAVFGGAPIATQQSRLRHGAQVVVATVGRMMDLISRRSLVLTSARYVVLDEADEMLDLGFIEDVEKILRMCPSGRQTGALLGDDAGPDRAPGRGPHVRPGDDQGDAEAAHRRRDRAGLRLGRAEGEDRPAGRGAEGRGARAGDHLLPHQDRRREARQAARRPRPAGEGAARRHEPGPARRRDDPVQGAGHAAAGRHRRRRPRARHRARHPRDQLRPAQQHRDLRAPDRAHRAGRAHRARDHLRHPQAGRRDSADRARGEDQDRRVGAARGADRARAAAAAARPRPRARRQARPRDRRSRRPATAT